MFADSVFAVRFSGIYKRIDRPFFSTAEQCVGCSTHKHSPKATPVCVCVGRRLLSNVLQRLSQQQLAGISAELLPNLTACKLGECSSGQAQTYCVGVGLGFECAGEGVAAPEVARLNDTYYWLAVTTPVQCCRYWVSGRCSVTKGSKKCIQLFPFQQSMLQSILYRTNVVWPIS